MGKEKSTRHFLVGINPKKDVRGIAGDAYDWLGGPHFLDL
jgi:hypothetical protein